MAIGSGYSFSCARIHTGSGGVGSRRGTFCKLDTHPNSHPDPLAHHTHPHGYANGRRYSNAPQADADSSATHTHHSARDLYSDTSVTYPHPDATITNAHSHPYSNPHRHRAPLKEAR